MSDSEDGALLRGAQGRRAAESRLRDALRAGRLAPGQRLVETELAERLGVNRSSAHFALRALEAEGLVERIPNRGAVVRSISLPEAIGIMEVRRLLDGLLSRKAAEQATGDELAELDANRRAMEQAVAARDFVEYSELIQEHHRLVREFARHPVASQLEEQLHWQILRHQFPLSLRPQRADQSLQELQDIVRAVVDRDAERAEKAAHTHFDGVIAALMQEPDAG